jgi:hypothetical protein
VAVTRLAKAAGALGERAHRRVAFHNNYFASDPDAYPDGAPIAVPSGRLGEAALRKPRIQLRRHRFS